MALKPLMIAGTASNVGKSILATAFCRIFKQDGFSPAPFKAQNMSLNSYATPEGLEIGRSQAAQAEAAGIPCHTDMNPVPPAELAHGIAGYSPANLPEPKTAYEYFKGGKLKLFEEVKTAYNRLASKHNPIVIEGAGSAAELNLKDRDIVNMRMALHADASVLLVADIDRGGVFASAYGSVKLLPDNERKLVKGILVNKFRGDIRLFDEGVKILEDITGVPVLGVIPYMTGIDIDEEDSVSLEEKNTRPVSGKINVAVIRLRETLQPYRFPDAGEYTGSKRLLHLCAASYSPGGYNHHSRQQKHARRSAQALYDAGIAAALQSPHTGQNNHRYLRRLPDAGPGRKRPPRRRVAAQNHCRAGTASPSALRWLLPSKPYKRTFTAVATHRGYRPGYEIHMGVHYANRQRHTGKFLRRWLPRGLLPRRTLLGNLHTRLVR